MKIPVNIKEIADLKAIGVELIRMHLYLIQTQENRILNICLRKYCIETPESMISKVTSLVFILLISPACIFSALFIYKFKSVVKALIGDMAFILVYFILAVNVFI